MAKGCAYRGGNAVPTGGAGSGDFQAYQAPGVSAPKRLLRAPVSVILSAGSARLLVHDQWRRQLGLELPAVGKRWSAHAARRQGPTGEIPVKGERAARPNPWPMPPRRACFSWCTHSAPDHVRLMSVDGRRHAHRRARERYTVEYAREDPTVLPTMGRALAPTGNSSLLAPRFDQPIASHRLVSRRLNLFCGSRSQDGKYRVIASNAARTPMALVVFPVRG